MFPINCCSCLEPKLSAVHIAHDCQDMPFTKCVRAKAGPFISRVTFESLHLGRFHSDVVAATCDRQQMR